MAEALMPSDVFFSDLDILCNETKRKVLEVKRILQFRNIDYKPSIRYGVFKIRQQMIILHDILSKMESEVQRNVKLNASLNELQEAAEGQERQAQYFMEKVLPNRVCQDCVPKQSENRDEHQLIQETKLRKPTKPAVLPAKVPAKTSRNPGQVPVVPKQSENRDEHHLIQETKLRKPTKLTRVSEVPALPAKVPAKTSRNPGQVPVVPKQSENRDEHQLIQETKLRKPTKLTRVSEVPALPAKVPAKTSRNPGQVPVVPKQSENRDEHQLIQETKLTKPTKPAVLPAKLLPVTSEDFGQVPVYMKGRLTCEQINAVIKDINKAVMIKYKIRNQSPRSLSAPNRNLYYRYMKEETEATEGCSFIVEEDIKLFTCLKTDKRFYQVITILRHCRRLKEVRTTGVTRYLIC
ncbi:spindle and kinetochore-associated protein 1 [Strigops habroptila]|uniref:SKA complex subunit 1 n=1 Tax=Strigops habroptila TaxID=2489341 RepID=A0A672UDM5_STRHB|nr:spindle and kinetochore-associated protein 1 [Strigops habroptila]